MNEALDGTGDVGSKWLGKVMGQWQCWFGESARVVAEKGWHLITPRVSIPLPAESGWLLPLWQKLCEAPQDLDEWTAKLSIAQRQQWQIWRQRFTNLGLWHHCLMIDEEPQLDLMANGVAFEPGQGAPIGDHLRLSRDVFFRRVGNQLRLAAASSPVEVRIHAPLVGFCLQFLAAPLSTAAATTSGQRALLSALVQVAFLVNPVAESAHAWPFHEALFHHRRTQGDATSLPGQKHVRPDQAWPVYKLDAGPWTPLPPPQHQRVAMSLSAVFSARRSQRAFDPTTTLNHEQLSTWLAWTYGVQQHVESAYGFTKRPTPSGGALHPLELYLIVHRVDGLVAGVYRYLAQEHGLERLGDYDQLAAAFLHQASQTMAAEHVPVLVAVTARISRVQQVYAHMAYALCLQDCGALWQSFYLVATALGLGGCVSGWADDRYLAKLVHVVPEQEPMMGAFALGVPAKGAGQ